VSSDPPEPVSRREALSYAGLLAGGLVTAGTAETVDAQEGSGSRPVWPSYVSDATDEGYEDLRGQSEVTVTVGPDGNFSFAPTRMWVDPGTTITFEWAADFHNVMPESQPSGAEWEGSPGSETYDTGYTFQSTFETEGMYAYYCQPHEGQGMKGAIAVGDEVETEQIGGGGGASGQPVWPSYVSDARDQGYQDWRGQSEATIEVGAGPESLAFSPTRTWVDPGTTITWEWTGEGGDHNVVANDGTFDSGDTINEGGTTFEHTFESVGMYTYHCAPHEALGMKGAIAVGDVETQTPRQTATRTAIEEPSLPDSAQAWTYSEGDDGSAGDVIETSDGNYLFLGSTELGATGIRNAWLVKVDTSGDVLWSQTYGGNGDDYASDVIETSDGGYLFAGDRGSSDGGDDAWLVRVDESGETQWNRTYGGDGDDSANAVVETSDGGYLFAGYTVSSEGAGGNAWLVKVDDSGEARWSQTYRESATGSATAEDIIKTSDGEYLLAGTTNPQDSETDFALIVKLDDSGERQWSRTYSGADQSGVSTVVETGDGNYLFAGLFNSFERDGIQPWLVKIDRSGEMQWSDTYPEAGSGLVHDVVETNTGNYAFAGNRHSTETDTSGAWLGAVDPEGEMQWSQTYSGQGDDGGFAVIQTSDGRYVVAGYTESYGRGNGRAWLIADDRARSSGHLGGIGALEVVAGGLGTTALGGGALWSWNRWRKRSDEPESSSTSDSAATDTQSSVDSGRSEEPASSTEPTSADRSIEDVVEEADALTDTAEAASEDGEYDRAVSAWRDARDAYETAYERARDVDDDRTDELRDRLEAVRASLDAAVDTRDAADRFDDLLADAREARDRAESALDDGEYAVAEESLDRALARLDNADDVAGEHDLATVASAAERERVTGLRDRLERERTTGPPERIPRAPDLSLSYDKLEDRELIGHGGNADVYRVTALAPDGNTLLAVKEPRVEGTLHTETVDRLLNEAETWDRIDDHDHVVGVVDYDSDPLPWIAMEYMDAGDLSERAGALELDQALWTAVSVTEAVRHAHRHGVAHLDLKPQNVLFRSVDDAWDVPKVADWGLSKHLLRHSKSVEGLSPQYAAPEQFNDEYGTPDDLTDVYQLGAVFYELFTGEPVFDGQPAAVMHKALHEEPTPPSEVADLPPELDDILLTALATERADRYESVLYLRDALEGLLDDQSR